MSVKLYVRDNTNGKVHEYGTNQHDALILQEDGSLHYHNLQNGCGTMYPDEGYTFCLADGSYPRTSGDYIHYGVEPYIDIGGNREEHQAKDIDVPTNRWIDVHDRLPEKDGNYIVTACDEGCSAGEGIWYSTVVVVAEYYKGSWTWYDGGSEYSLEGIVTHWMPMPEPPEREKTEE